MWDGFNKRKFPRLSLRCEVIILSEGVNTPLHATTENLGIGGVCMILDQPLDRFSICHIKLYLDDEQIESDGKVVWIVPTRDLKSNKKRYDIGLEFVGLAIPQIARIRQFIEKKALEVPETLHPHK